MTNDCLPYLRWYERSISIKEKLVGNTECSDNSECGSKPTSTRVSRNER